MKKQDRIERAEQRSHQIANYVRQGASVDLFVNECRIAMATNAFDEYHSEATAAAGNSFHIFDAMVYALSRTKTQITPGLRKAIEEVLDSHELERSQMSLLSTLQYDDYWKQQYGYN